MLGVNEGGGALNNLRGNMKKLFVGAAIAGMGLLGLGTGVAAATPGVVDCSNPCVNRAADLLASTK